MYTVLQNVILSSTSYTYNLYIKDKHI